MTSTGDASHERVEVLVDLGRLPEAERMARLLLAEAPDDVHTMLLLAQVLERQERSREAAEIATRAVQAAPDLAEAHKQLAMSLLGGKDAGQALAAATEAVRLAPHDWTTHYVLGMALREGRLPRYRDALDAANRAIRLAPWASPAHNLAGMCLDDLLMPEIAMQAYTEALRLDPQSASVLNNIAALQANHGKLRQASGFLTAGLSADAQEKILHANYDFILFKLMTRLFWTEVGFGVLIAILAGAAAPWYTRTLAGIAMCGAFVLVARGVLSALPRGARRHALQLPRRARGSMLVGIVVFVLATLAVLGMAVTPREMSLAIGLGFLVLLRLLAIVGLVAGAVALVGQLFRRGR